MDEEEKAPMMEGAMEEKPKNVDGRPESTDEDMCDCCCCNV
jgi:hypothetical protein